MKDNSWRGMTLCLWIYQKPGRYSRWRPVTETKRAFISQTISGPSISTGQTRVQGASSHCLPRCVLQQKKPTGHGLPLFQLKPSKGMLQSTWWGFGELLHQPDMKQMNLVNQLKNIQIPQSLSMTYKVYLRGESCTCNNTPPLVQAKLFLPALQTNNWKHLVCKCSIETRMIVIDCKTQLKHCLHRQVLTLETTPQFLALFPSSSDFTVGTHIQCRKLKVKTLHSQVY